MNLGENIYKLRTGKNLSQGGLADALEVSRQSVSKWENNSAVPELDKLIKMAEVFGVTLDELVTGQAPEAATPVQPEPQVVYIEKPVKQGLTATQILGIILTVCSLLALVLYLCVYGARNDFLDSPFILCIPAAVIGTVCIITKRHVGYFCALAGYLLGWFPAVFLLTGPATGTMGWIVHCTLVLCGVTLLIYTIVRFRSLQLNGVFKAVILALLALTLIIRLSAMSPPRELEAVTGGDYSVIIDASISPN